MGTGTDTRRFDMDSLVCDHCNNQIKDGERCVAITLWRGDEPGQWEHKYGLSEKMI